MSAGANGSSVTGTCGLGILWNHTTQQSEYQPAVGRAIQDAGGTGLIVTGFINEPRCKAVYDHIRANHPILYQSPVVRNKNSRRDNFFIIFDRNKRK